MSKSVAIQRASRYTALLAELKDHFNNLGTVQPDEIIQQLAMDALKDEFQQSCTLNNTMSQSNYQSTHQRLQTVANVVGKFNPASKVPIHQFLSKFESTFSSVTGNHPSNEQYDVVRNFLTPLLEGSAFNELSNSNAIDYDSLSQTLRARYGKTEDEVITELLNYKQGSQSVEEYLDQITDIATQASVSERILITAAKSNLHAEYSQQLCTLLQTYRVTNKQTNVAEIFSCLRAYAHDQSIRKKGVQSQGSTNNPKNCSYCGKNGHTEDNCFIKKNAMANNKNKQGGDGVHMTTGGGSEELPLPPNSHQQLVSFVDLANSNKPAVDMPAQLPAPADNSGQLVDLQSVILIQECMDLASATDPQKVVQEPLAASVDFIYHTATKTHNNASAQVNLPKLVKSLTPAELLSRVRMSSTFLDYAQHNREFRMHALIKLIWQQVQDELPVVIPNQGSVVGVDQVDYLDMTKVVSAVNAWVAARDAARSQASPQVPAQLPGTSQQSLPQNLQQQQQQQLQMQQQQMQQQIMQQMQQQQQFQQRQQLANQQQQPSTDASMSAQGEQLQPVPVQPMYANNNVASSARANYLSNLLQQVRNFNERPSAASSNPPQFSAFQCNVTWPGGAPRILPGAGPAISPQGPDSGIAGAPSLKAFAVAVQKANDSICWEVSLPRKGSLPPAIDKTSIKFDPKGNPYHYLLPVQVNQYLLHAIFDTGASFSCVSAGLAKALGWEVVNDLPGSVSGVEGVSQPLAGRIVSPTLKFSEDFEITVSHLVVLPSPQPLFLLGNDIFNAHEAFTFLQLRAAGPVPTVELWDATRSKVITLSCTSGPRLGSART